MRSLLMAPFVWIVVGVSAMAGPITPGDLDSSLNQKEGSVVESVENAENDFPSIPPEILEDFLRGIADPFAREIARWAASSDPLFAQSILDWASQPPVVEEGEESTFPEAIVPESITVPEPTSNGLALVGVGLLVGLAAARRIKFRL